MEKGYHLVGLYHRYLTKIWIFRLTLSTIYVHWNITSRSLVFSQSPHIQTRIFQKLTFQKLFNSEYASLFSASKWLNFRKCDTFDFFLVLTLKTSFALILKVIFVIYESKYVGIWRLKSVEGFGCRKFIHPSFLRSDNTCISMVH